jgi:cytochrome c oxidase accessory protein FixG
LKTIPILSVAAPAATKAEQAAAAASASAAPETVSLYEKQKKLYPRSVKASGWFARWRWALVWLTQLLFYGLPWLPWNGRPAVLFDLAARRFYIFDLVLYPQDFIYLTGLLVLSAYGLFFFTAVAGRLWCGYACPQTVYTEIFLWVEHHIEGERGARMRLDAGPWNVNKWSRKIIKHAVWITIAWWTGFTFVGYFTPIHTLWAEAFTLSFGPWEWFWVNFYGLATYGNAGFLREQVCKYMCPYARFQSAMFDKDTLIVSYDAKRGEPRGAPQVKRAHDHGGQAAATGDCIACKLCVQVCPTGIDIRDGLQYECIACTACIDACDSVMDKMRYPRGLIRYATQNSLSQGLTQPQMWRRVLRPRVLIYGVVLLGIAAAFVTSLAMRAPIRVDVVRDRATLGREVAGGQIENLYRLQVMNATERSQRLHVQVLGLPTATLGPAQDVDLPPAQARWVTLAVRLPAQQARTLGPGAHAMQFEVTSTTGAGQAAARLLERSTFVIPR